MADLAYLAGTGFLILVSGIYCAVRAVWDWRDKRVGIAFIGTALAALLLATSASILLMPIETHTVKIDLPSQ